VIALDAGNGKVVWDKTVLEVKPQFPKHLKNTYASETPVTDGERIYAYFGNVGVYALDFAGNVVWERPVEVVKTRYGWGTAASPIVHGDLLFVVNDNEDSSYMAALDTRTGKEKWRVTRDEGTNWVTPFVWQNEQRTELITAGTDRVRSYSLDGKLLWEFGGMSSIAIPQPFAAHGLLYVSSGYVGDQKRPVFAIKPGASGDITLAEGTQSNDWIVWFLPQAGAYNPTPLVYGDHLYTLLDRGFFTMHDARTGEMVYDKQRIERGASAFTASPWAYNGKIFVLSEDGDTFVIDAGKEFKVIAKNSLDEMCMATPAIADGSLYIRTRANLYRLSNQAAARALTVEGRAGVGIARLQAAREPRHPLLRAAVGERLGDDAALHLLLEPIVADGGGGSHALLEIPGLEQPGLIGVLAPDAGEAVGLQLEPHRQRVDVLLRP
jgi:outer membrane protein assembly factor BamB